MHFVHDHCKLVLFKTADVDDEVRILKALARSPVIWRELELPVEFLSHGVECMLLDSLML